MLAHCSKLSSNHKHLLQNHCLKSMITQSTEFIEKQLADFNLKIWGFLKPENSFGEFVSIKTFWNVYFGKKWYSNVTLLAGAKRGTVLQNFKLLTLSAIVFLAFWYLNSTNAKSDNFSFCVYPFTFQKILPICIMEAFLFYNHQKLVKVKQKACS